MGLSTNPTGLVRTGSGLRSTIDALYDHPDVDLTTLFGPEHGIRGDAAEGARVSDGVDDRTGIPVVSLYDGSLEPHPEELAGIDVFVFDMQDIGTRYYTYVWSMSLAMQAAGEAGVRFVVLDRPNPIGGDLVQGNVLDTAFASYIGLHPVPMRHGLTPGEMARLIVAEFGVEVDLTVIPADGWTRSMPFADTGIPWVAPSPNMPSIESALHYPGTCLFEGTPLSVGRGTDIPFQHIGAPWIDGEALAAALNERGLPGVRFEATRFTPESPSDGKFGGEELGGVRFVATDPDVYDPTVAAVAALIEARWLSGERWSWRADHFDLLAGTDALRLGIEAGEEVGTLTAGWADQVEAFRRLREKVLLYR